MSHKSYKVFIILLLSVFLTVNAYAQGPNRSERRAQKLTTHIEAAKQGNAEDQLWLGLHYTRKGSSFDQGLYWLNEAVAQNSAPAQFELAFVYMNFSSHIKGSTPQQNREIIDTLLQKSAEGGYHKAQLAIGKRAGRDKDFGTAIAWFQKAAEQENVGAMELLSQMASQGIGMQQDHKVGFNWAKQAAENGSINAKYRLAMHYGMGVGVAKNDAKANLLINEAALGGDRDAMQFLYNEAQQNNVIAQFALAKALEKNNDHGQANTFYLQAAKNGNDIAKDKISAAYTNVTFLTEDPTEIVGWITQKAEAGNDIAQCQLARIYSSLLPNSNIPTNTSTTNWITTVFDNNSDCGQNLAYKLLNADSATKQEHQLALKWLTTQAEQNNLDAQSALGSKYLNGSVAVPQDTKKALRWLYKVAGNGDVGTQYVLGFEYLIGINLKKSFVTGMAFYFVAASGEIVNDDTDNNYWIREAKEKIAESRKDYPNKSRELKEAQKLARKLIAKFNGKS